MSIESSLARVRRETGIKRCMVLEGNVGDVFLTDGRIRNLCDTLATMFAESDFTDVVRWDRISGFRGGAGSLPLADGADGACGEGEPYGLGGGGCRAWDAGSADGMCKDVGDMLAVVNRTLSDRCRRTLFILDWSEYMFSAGGQLDPDDRRNLTLLGKAARDAAPAYGSGGGRRSSAVIVIASRASMLPPSLYSGNPEAGVVTVGKPDMEERRRMLSKISPGFALEGGLSPSDGRFEDYVDMLDGFTNREMMQMANMSHSERGLTFEKLYYLFRYGEKDNPWEKLDRDKVAGLGRFLSERVVGQERAVDHVCRTIVKAFMGVTGMHKTSSRSMPKGVFFFVGPTGVGKTELSKAIAKFLFGDEGACIRFDMSEYAQPNSDQKLIGAPPGYVGYEEGGQLTNAIRERPFSVVLFDEIEKAAKPNPRILDMFLQILEDGRLTDSRGITASFSDAIIIFTSNLGAGEVACCGDREAAAGEFVRIVREYFDSELKRPEILGRIGLENIVPFDFIDDPAFAEGILRSKMGPVRDAVLEKYGIDLAVEDEGAFFAHILGGADAARGGRGILNALDSGLLSPLAEFLFDNYDDLPRLRGMRLVACVADGGTRFRADAEVQRRRVQDLHLGRGPGQARGDLVPGLRHPVRRMLQPGAAAVRAQARDDAGGDRLGLRGGRAQVRHRGRHPAGRGADAAGRRPALRRPPWYGPGRHTLHGAPLRGPEPVGGRMRGPGGGRPLRRRAGRRVEEPCRVLEPADRRRVREVRGRPWMVRGGEAPEGGGEPGPRVCAHHRGPRPRAACRRAGARALRATRRPTRTPGTSSARAAGGPAAARPGAPSAELARLAHDYISASRSNAEGGCGGPSAASLPRTPSRGREPEPAGMDFRRR